MLGMGCVILFYLFIYLFIFQFNVPFKIISLISRRANRKVGRNGSAPGKPPDTPASRTWQSLSLPYNYLEKNVLALVAGAKCMMVVVVHKHYHYVACRCTTKYEDFGTDGAVAVVGLLAKTFR